MSGDVDQALNAALALPNGERVELVEALLASLRPGDRPPFDESLRAVIERRSSELESGSVVGIPWSDVKKRALEFERA
jgi:putative addiction module component (TIGR02574 family)